MSLRHFLLPAVLLFASAAGALADPPSRVGRISYLEGPISLFRPDQAQWSAADLNFPVTAGDALWSGQGARLEVQIGATEIRLDEQSEIDLLRLDEEGAAIRVDQGIVNVHLSNVPPGGVQIVTTAGQLDLLRPGSYHIDAGRPVAGAMPNLVQIAVIDGEARLSGQRTGVDIRRGEAAMAGPDLSSFTLVPFAITAFDSWAMAREQSELASLSTPYVSPEMTGYQDLAGNGQWANSPDYGPLWIPTAVAPDWAPYRFGHWTFIEPWGWTWIDDAPWGFAPFHYGRWVEWHDRWAWCPGRVVERPVYAPALVAFIGSPGTGVSITVGNRPTPGVGWVPLGPHEAFHPYYHVSEHYVHEVNVSHVANVTNETNVTVNNYVNQRAVTVVPNGTFTGAGSVNRAAIPVGSGQFSREPVITNLGHLQPTSRPQPGPSQPGPTQPGNWPSRGPGAFVPNSGGGAGTSPANVPISPQGRPDFRPAGQMPQQQNQPTAPQTQSLPQAQTPRPAYAPQPQSTPQPQPQAAPRPMPQPQTMPQAQPPAQPALHPQPQATPQAPARPQEPSQRENRPQQRGGEHEHDEKGHDNSRGERQ